MTPAIDYIIRSKSVQDLFLCPITVGMWDEEFQQKQWVTLSQKRGKYLLQRWDLESCNITPIEEVFIRSKKDILKKHLIIPKGLQAIPFIDCPVEKRHNHFSKPMDKERYEGYYNHIFNPNRHTNFKKNWLWYCFSISKRLDCRYIERCSSLLSSRQFDSFCQISSKHLSAIRSIMSSRIVEWSQLELATKANGIEYEEVAGELIFSSS